MRRLHIIGRKNHGKTQLVVELVEELTVRGLRVATIKHTHHHHELGYARQRLAPAPCGRSGCRRDSLAVDERRLSADGETFPWVPIAMRRLP